MGRFNGPVVPGQRAQVLFLGQRQTDASLLSESGRYSETLTQKTKNSQDSEDIIDLSFFPKNFLTIPAFADTVWRASPDVLFLPVVISLCAAFHDGKTLTSAVMSMTVLTVSSE